MAGACPTSASCRLEGVISEPIRIGRYTLRPVTEADRERVALWISQDDDHRNRVEPGLFLTSNAGCECYAVEDGGEVVFFLRMTRVLRLDIQFGPDWTAADRARNREAMTAGFAWLRAAAAASGTHEIIFDSTVPQLVAFAAKRLDFQHAPGLLSCVIPQLPAPESED